MIPLLTPSRVGVAALKKSTIGRPGLQQGGPTKTGGHRRSYRRRPPLGLRYRTDCCRRTQCDAPHRGDHLFDRR
nr:hypothetical protein HmN_000913900 [Hymenolepis microstoma]